MSVLVTWSHIFPGWSSLKALVILLDWHWSVYFVGTTMCWQKGIRYAITYSPNHSYTYKGGWEVLKQQWISVLTAQHHISHADLVSKLICFEIWEYIFDRRGMVLTMMQSYIRWERHFKSLLYIWGRLENTQAAMNVCTYDRVSYFPGWSDAKIGNFSWNLSLYLVETTMCWHKGD